jgi:hypothetical protein
MAVPRLTRRFGNATLLAGSLAISVVGMAWLGRLSADTPYLTGIALAMILIGAGQGGALGPLTAAGIAAVAPEDAGAAGGVTNVAHQLAGSLGLGILVAVFAAADSTTLRSSELLAHRIGTSLTVGAGMLALAVVIALVVRPGRPADVANDTRVRKMALAAARAGKSRRLADARSRPGRDRADDRRFGQHQQRSAWQRHGRLARSPQSTSAPTTNSPRGARWIMWSGGFVGPSADAGLVR